MPRPRGNVQKRRILAKRMCEVSIATKSVSAAPEGPSQYEEPQPSTSSAGIPR